MRGPPKRLRRQRWSGHPDWSRRRRHLKAGRKGEAEEPSPHSGWWRMTPAPAVTVYKNYDPAVRPLALDAEWMERVVLNLLVNAAQASSSGSVVTLRTRQVSGAETEIAVIDRGSGVAPEHRGSIFNPFFTTKKEGVGLGLAIVAKIVDEHGGRLEFDSEPGRGSVFRLLLPAVAGA